MRKLDAAILELAPSSNAAWLGRAQMGATSAKVNRALGLLKEASNELEERIRNN
jgi:hypothetical protein